ncbi:MAG TPA: COX15/CtaA family protein [Gaiellaceae bacterium]|nr:COX15/CtaA family protein [Gaiellaceae bacterium]
MHVAASRIERFRTAPATPELFRASALATVVGLYLVVSTGAVVRLTASGLGCDNWPRCGNTPFPEKGGHAFIEFGNRVIALCAIVATLVCWLAARRTPRLAPWVRALALAVFLGSVAQIPLGGLTVIFHLNPLLVMAHFLLAVLVLGGAVVLGLEAHRLVAGGAAPVGRAWLRRAGVALGVACFVLVVTGAFATAAGPHPGGSDVHRLGEALRSTRVHAVTTLVFAVSFLALLTWLQQRRHELPRVANAALGLLALLGAQVAVGEVQYHTGLPWWLVLVHVSVAAAVWAWTVGFVWLLHRPPASFAECGT